MTAADAMPDLPATEFLAVVSGDGALVPPDDVRAALVPGQTVHVRVAEPRGESAVENALARIGRIANYQGPPVPLEQMSIETMEGPAGDEL